MGLTCILAMSAVYEIIEWALAMALAPDWAEAYNGQQGDMWDSQKDMALATAGAIITLLVRPFLEKCSKRKGLKQT